MPPEGFADPVTGDGTRFHPNVPISKLTERITRAIEASDVAFTVAKNYGRGDSHKMNRPLTESPPRVGAQGRPDL